MSQAAKGRRFSKEHRLHSSLSHQNPSKELIERNRERNKARWEDPKFVSRMRELRKVKPTKRELILQNILNKYFPNTYKYVGDFQVTIGGKCPDFINVNGKKKVIEMFGSFYHKIDEVEQIIKHYAKYGFSCLVIWEEELDNPEAVFRHIRNDSIHSPSNNGHPTIFDYRHKAQVILDSSTKKFKVNN